MSCAVDVLECGCGVEFGVCLDLHTMIRVLVEALARVVRAWEVGWERSRTAAMTVI